MLPSQLLRARVRGSRLYLLWAKGTEVELELARELIEAFKQGRRLSEIHEQVEEIEEMYELAGIDFKLVRGLAILLERASEFERPSTRVDPERAREVVYRLVNAKYGGFVMEELRDRVLEEAASELGLSKEDLEETLWADTEEAQVLVRPPPYEPGDLLKRYNLSLLQTALFRALSMTVTTRASGGEVKRMLRSLKRLRLMYMADQGHGVIIKVSGPASVLKMTTRYGTSLAKLIPYVVSMSHWEIQTIISRKKGRPALLRVCSRERDLFPEIEWQEPTYDSVLEKSFASIAEAGGWKVVREPEPLISGRSIVIPDFLLEKGSAKLYVEVMGFWTPEYVEKKLKKLTHLRELMLVVAKKDLLCSKIEKIPKDLFLIEGSKIDKVSLLRKLDELERRALSKEFKVTDGDLEGLVVSLRGLARSRGLTLNQLKQILSLREYAVLGDYAVRRDLVNSFREMELPKSVKDLKSLLRSHGLPEDLAIPLASELGYEVIWRGLDEDDAEIAPKNRTSG